MTRYEWTGSHELIRLHTDERISHGEVFEPTERERDAFNDRLTKADASGEATESDASSGETDEEQSSEDTPLSEKHWRTAVTEIEDGEHDDRLSELADDEDLTDSVRDAVEERQSELGE